MTKNSTTTVLSSKIRAVAYVRSATVSRQSIMNQMGVVMAYAESKNMEIVRIYSDEGKSGLTAEGRERLNHLIRDVESRQADFEVVLLCDASRWGRFQDLMRLHHYERLCERVGIEVHYCEEALTNVGHKNTVTTKPFVPV